MNPTLLETKDLAKRFGILEVISNVSFSMEKGEVIGVVGQSGSGKTALFNLLFGVEQPTDGNIFIEDEQVLLSSPVVAHHYGIEAVLDPPFLVGNLSVTRNIFLGREIHWPFQSSPLPNFSLMYSKAKELLDRFKVTEEILSKKITDLSIEEKTIISLVKALSAPSRILLLDNTLTNLSYPRQHCLLNIIDELSAQDVSIIVSSDDLKSLFSITDRMLVLYKGSLIATRTTRDSTPREIVELMVGTNVKDRVTPVIWAIENYHSIQKKSEDLYRKQKNLQVNLAAQGNLNAELIQKLQDQINASEQLTIALQAANIRAMSEGEEQRKVIAREIHDQTIQDLLSFNYRIEQLEDECVDKNQKDELAYICNGIRRIVVELRQLCSDLRPPTIDKHGLSTAIRSLVEDWSERNQPLEIKAEIDKGLGRFSEPIELSIFRIIQEGLNNIAKHSEAKSAKLIIRRASNSSLQLRIIDDGKGLNKPVDLADLSLKQHYGLVGISERVALLGGKFKVVTPKNGGLELHIEILNPYP